jgi:hypothetical protein
MITKAANAITERVKTPDVYEEFSFAIQKFSINPPSINIQIRLIEKTGYFDYNRHLRVCSRYEAKTLLESATEEVDTIIDVDIVPGTCKHFYIITFSY